MIPSVIKSIPNGNWSILRRHIVQTTPVAGDVQSIVYKGYKMLPGESEGSGRLRRHIWTVTLDTDQVTAVQWARDMRVTLAGCTWLNGRFRLLSVDTANDAFDIVTDIDNSIPNQTSAAGTATPCGVVSIGPDSQDGTPIYNDEGKMVLLEYDEAGEFPFKMDNADYGKMFMIHVIRTSATGNLTVNLKISTMPSIWVDMPGFTQFTLDTESDVIIVNYIMNCWVKVVTSDLAADTTYAINLVG